MKTAYVLITPVHNEEQLLPQLMEAVASQTILPKRWIIVDDGSTDATPDILKQYDGKYDFVVHVRLDRLAVESYYSRRAFVVLEGIKAVEKEAFDFLGVLDGDITMEPTYYEDVLREFDRDPKLGLASGVYLDRIDGRLREVLIDPGHVPGGLTLFRRECYDAIGGYIPQKYGGEDSCAEIMARHRGWKTHSFRQYRVVHHRPVGTGQGGSILKARFRQGLTEYGVATHPLFMLAKTCRRAVLERPYIVGSMARLAGFVYGYLKRETRRMPADVVDYVRQEQMRRLFACLRTGGGT